MNLETLKPIEPGYTVDVPAFNRLVAKVNELVAGVNQLALDLGRLTDVVANQVFRPCGKCGGRGFVNEFSDVNGMACLSSHACPECQGRGVRVQGLGT